MNTDTKEIILETAERLFARDGYHATSLRNITGEAGVNLAAVNYHFGSKQALVEEVIKHRLLPLNQVRVEALEKVLAEARKSGQRAKAKDILMAFVRPTLRFRETEPGAGNFTTFIGRTVHDPDDTVRNVFLKLMMPLFNRFYESLCESLPQVPSNEVFWRLHFVLGMTTHIMCMMGKLPPVIQGVKTNPEMNDLITMLETFITGGVEA